MTVYDAEIDLRPYLISIIQNWWKVAIFSLLAIVGALWLGLRQPYEYEANATILLTRSRAALLLASEFPTLNEPVDSTSRMSAFLSIAKSDALAYHTLSILEEEIPPEERDLESFKSKVTITNTGDLILVSAKTTDQLMAQRIANVWAEQAVSAINLAYSGDQLPTQVEQQLESAKADYESFQAALETFLESSQLNVLQKRIMESEALFNSLSNSRAWKVIFFTQRIQDLDQIILRGEALRQQLEGSEGSNAASIGDAIAVLAARATTFGISISPISLPDEQENSEEASSTVVINNSPGNQEGLTIGLDITEISMLNGSNANYERDLNTLIELAQSEKAKAEQNLQDLSSDVLSNESVGLVQQAASEIQVLNAQLENELARQKELTSERDLAWKAYQVLAEKNAELKNATSTNSQVNIATLAVPPEKPESRGILTNVAIGAVLGTLLGALVVLLVQWWRQSVIVTTRTEKPAHVVDLK